MKRNWLICAHPNPDADLRLFCLPYAGGGAAIFRGWAAQLSPSIEVYAIQLPGREHRISEPAFTQLQPLVEAAATALLPYLDRPFVFFGHSMGGLLAFELTRWLDRPGVRYPARLLISGCRAPQLSNSSQPLHALPDAEFIEALRLMNGTPEAVLTNSELMAVLMPTLRADFTLIETYTYQAGLPLRCPIAAFGGLEDGRVSPTDLDAWSVHTAAFQLHLLPGDHFFIHSARSTLLQMIYQRYLTAYPTRI